MMEGKKQIICSLALLPVALEVLGWNANSRTAGVQRLSSKTQVLVGNHSAPPRGSATAPGLQFALASLPLSFQPNQGQAAKQVRFLSQGSGCTLFLTGNEAVLQMPGTEDTMWNVARGEPGARLKGHGVKGPMIHAARPVRPFTPSPVHAGKPGPVLRLQLLGANPNPGAAGQEELQGKSNYFIGSDPQKWRTNVLNYARVYYNDIYPGVDLVYYGSGRQLEHDFVVHSGANPAVIRLGFQMEGSGKSLNSGKNLYSSKSLYIDGQGDLRLEVGGGDVTLRKPAIYQELNGVKHPVSGGYRLIKQDSQHLPAAHGSLSNAPGSTLYSSQVGFWVAAYDKRRPLVIDPILAYSTYLGGSSTDAANAIAVDSSGDIYIAGDTISSDFPASAALPGTHREIFVARLNPTGSALLYSSYFGGSSIDEARGIAVDSSGSVYVTGDTSSSDFPVVRALQLRTGGGSSDAFVTKLSPSGDTVVYSTYLGGSGNDVGQGIALDSSHSVYLTGWTDSVNFPTLNPIQSANAGHEDAFVAKLSPDASSLVYSTYLGGNQTDIGEGIGLDSTGSAYVTGFTDSTNFPTANAIQSAYGGSADAFVTRLSPDGSSLVYSTYLGGSGTDGGHAIAVDSTGSAYITGEANNAILSNGTPIRSDAFVTKLNSAGSLVYSTYLRGSSEDQGDAIAVDSTGSAYITGFTMSTDFPLQAPLQAAYGGGIFGGDAFVSKLSPDGAALLFSTYLGGSNDDIGLGITLDSKGVLYVVGRTNSTNFPTTNSLQGSYGGGQSDAFVTIIDLRPPAPAGLAATPGQASVYLSWSASPGVYGYNVKRSTSPGGPYTLIGAGITSTTYLDAGLNKPNRYYYVVSALASNGESANSNEASAEPFLPNLLGLAIAVDAHNQSHLLWTNTNTGSIMIWTISAGGTVLRSLNFGPYTGWSAGAIAVGPGDVSYVLWNNTSGQAAVQVIDPVGSFSSFAYGPYPGWSARDIAVDGAGGIHLLWNNISGEAALWVLNPDGSGRLGYNYGPFPGWSASSVALDTAGSSHLLWNNNSGQIAVWLLAPDLTFGSGYNYGPFTGWTARAVRADAAGRDRLLWTNITGEEATWLVGRDGALLAGQNYGPYSNWFAAALAIDANDNTRLLWDNLDTGEIAFWQLAPQGWLLGGENYAP